jgi:hypothetical protein
VISACYIDSPTTASLLEVEATSQISKTVGVFGSIAKMIVWFLKRGKPVEVVTELVNPQNIS